MKLFKSHIPFAKATSIYEIPADFYNKNNVKTLFVDLDNTLDSYKSRIPNDKVIKLINAIKATGVNVVILSNNKEKRVGAYARLVPCDYIFSTGKPFPKKINKYLKENNLNSEDVMLVGDQMITDVGVANHAKIRVILTDKIVKEDQWTTHINRLIGSLIRHYHNKHNNFINWREYYGES